METEFSKESISASLKSSNAIKEEDKIMPLSEFELLFFYGNDGPVSASDQTSGKHFRDAEALKGKQIEAAAEEEEGAEDCCF